MSIQQLVTKQIYNTQNRLNLTISAGFSTNNFHENERPN